ncbi:reverse transcriptase-like protein [Bacillus spongiae]|uniref:Reverse transcriptase-like protein n=1 Tax=Bacillus spongiae TaxID=2683610 RepID=A0ABU8HD27_9BACI
MKMKISFTYKVNGGEGTSFESEWMSRRDVLPLMEELHKLGRVKNMKVQDELGTEWSKKEYVKLNQQLETEPENVTLYFDGGYDRETSLAGIGVVVYYEKAAKAYRFRKNVPFEGIEHNNEAEYAALFEGLKVLEEIGVKHEVCVIKGDAQGVIMQLLGEWPCYENTLIRWLDRIEEKIEALSIQPKFELLPRKQNKEAHQLASQALRGKNILSHIQQP